ncbi:MAG: TIGR02266 family protein [Deltaproteobacteria bacterium]|jgi:uncharacterized protein (TIGR02266 family)|nr:TIGR02266 family protein [Deltaproteobacteria bacterium]
MTHPKERRSAPRYAVVVEVTFDSEHNFYTGLTQDLSNSGLFVATQSACPIGERVHVKMTLPTAPAPVEALTEVRWVRTRDVPGGGGKAGLGLMFVQMSSQAKEAVKAFLQQRESIFFDAD